MKRKILEEGLSHRPDGLLYHYTNQAGLLGIIGKKEIWATHTQYLNDTREFLHAVEIVRHELSTRAVGTDPGDEQMKAALREMLQGIENAANLANINVCVASFSKTRDSLAQWRAYGPRGGFCIGINGNRLVDLVREQEFYLAPCIYERVLQQRLLHALIEEVLEENTLQPRQPVAKGRIVLPGGNLRDYLLRYAPILKDPSFVEEQEWRIISPVQRCDGPLFDFREGRTMLIPFYRFPLHRVDGSVPIEEVIIGPTPDPQRSEGSVRSFLIRHGFSHAQVKVTCSEVPYRSW